MIICNKYKLSSLNMSPITDGAMQPIFYLMNKCLGALPWTFGAICIAANFALADDRLEYGEYLSGECVGCHLTEGETKGIPPIVGWPEGQFIAALESYKNGERDNKAMQNVAKSLGPEEMAALAIYYKSLKPDQD